MKTVRQALAILVLAAGAIHADPSSQERLERVAEGLRTNPCDTDLLRQRADLRCGSGDMTAALNDWDDAGRCNPTLAVIDLERSVCLARHGESRSAHFFVGRYLKTNPTSARGQLVEARALLALGEPAQSLPYFDAALTAAGAPPDDYLARTRAYRAAGQIDAAVAGLDVAITHMGAVPAFVDLATQLDLERHSFTTALARLDRLPPNMARSEIWLLRRADILEQAGDKDGARRVFAATVDAAAARPENRRNQPAIKEAVAAANAGLTRLARVEEKR